MTRSVYGATALQPAQDFTLIPEPIIPGENCLNLNVFTPDPGAANLPVLVWIHGGGFLSGAAPPRGIEAHGSRATGSCS